MDPSVTSLKRPGAFIRYGALQYLYHEYFRAPSRSPDVERSRRAASAVAGALRGARDEERCASSSSFISRVQKKEQLTKNLILGVGAKLDAGRQLETGQSKRLSKR